MLRLVGDIVWRGDQRIGWLEGHAVFAYSSGKIGYYDNSYVYNASGRKIAYFEGDYMKTEDGQLSIRLENLRDYVVSDSCSDHGRAAIRLLLGD